MSERDMEQHAQEQAASLVEQVATIRRLRDLGRADEAADELDEQLRERPYGISTTIVVDVVLYGGGPAGGIEFECSRGEHGLELTRARFYHQDWFEPRGYSTIDNDTADYLFELWGIEYQGGES